MTESDDDKFHDALLLAYRTDPEVRAFFNAWADAVSTPHI